MPVLFPTSNSYVRFAFRYTCHQWVAMFFHMVATVPRGGFVERIGPRMFRKGVLFPPFLLIRTRYRLCEDNPPPFRRESGREWDGPHVGSVFRRGSVLPLGLFVWVFSCVSASQEGHVVPVTKGGRYVSDGQGVGNPRRVAGGERHSFRRARRSGFPTLVIFHGLYARFASSLLCLRHVGRGLFGVFIGVLRLLCSPFSI